MLKTNSAALPTRSTPRPTLADAGYVASSVNPVFAAREQRLLRELSALSAMRAANSNAQSTRRGAAR